MKVGKNSIFTLNGEYKDIIKGGKQASIIFKKAEGEEGEYIINAKKLAIDSDGLVKFDGEKGDAIKSNLVILIKKVKGKF